ncbi:DUF4405 domain-containing protein [Rhizobium sp. ARZ01]|uniref:DUF4405 domain-containing protein n=1 Tax=Rhizobium sp. ARZ01 TaxID=2769313 RepID=UPI001786E0CE|nr:DUF4405 domain-containing protein [Rhizobium sp. ARZ01]MBD9374715.1 DUF4405 domain-containing protein [Rhizobium sp. ARZ01]
MIAVLKRYATPLITGLFLVSLVSGVAIFFHIGNATFHAMHEWLSMVLIAPFVLHVWKNWRPMTGYFGRRPMTVALLISLAAAVPFAWPGGEGRSGGPPQFALARVVLQNSPEKLAPLLGDTTDGLLARLNQRGFAVAADVPLSEIAERSGKNEFELVQALLAQER